MKTNGEKSIFALSILLILFLSIAMASASEDISIEDTTLSEDISISDDVSSINVDENLDKEVSDTNLQLSDNSSILGEDEDERNEVRIVSEYSYNNIDERITLDFHIDGGYDYLTNVPVKLIVNDNTIYDQNFDDKRINAYLKVGSNSISFLFLGNDEFKPANYNMNIVRYEQKANINVDPSQYGSTYELSGESDYNFSVNITDNDGNLVNTNLSVVFEDVGYRDDPSLAHMEFNINSAGNVSINSSKLSVGHRYKINIRHSVEGYSYYVPEYYFYLNVIEPKDVEFRIWDRPSSLVGDEAVISADLVISSNMDQVEGAYDVYLNDELIFTQSTDNHTIVIKNLIPGENKIRFVFNGTELLKSLEENITVRAYKSNTNINVVRNVNYMVPGVDYSFSVALLDDDGNLINKDFQVLIRDANFNTVFNQNFTGSSEIILSTDNLESDEVYTVYIIVNGDNETKSAVNDFEISVKEKYDTQIEVISHSPIRGNETIIYYRLVNPMEAIAGEIKVKVNEEEERVLDSPADWSLLNIEGLKNGENNISFKYEGSEKYNPSNKTISITAYDNIAYIIIDVRDAPKARDYSFDVSLIDSEGDLIDADINVRVVDENGTYEARYTILHGNGNISIPKDALFENHTFRIYADYAGDDNYPPVSINESFEVVDKLETYFDINYIEQVTNDSVDILFSIHASNGQQIEGLVEFYLNGTNIANVTSISEDYARVSIKNLTHGINQIGLKYNGDDIYRDCNDTFNISYLYESKINCDVPEKGFVGQTFSFTANLTDAIGNVIPEKFTAEIIKDDLTFDRTYNLTSNQAIEIPDLETGNYAIIFRFDGNEDYCTVSNTAEFKIGTDRTPTKIIYENMTTTAVAKVDGKVGEYFSVTLQDANGNPLANKDLQIGFNGVVYSLKTDSNGVAKLQINLGYKGAYTFAICYLGDDEYNASFEVAVINVNLHVPKLTAPAKTYKLAAKTKTLTATFKSANGNAISGKKISFTVNGKTYTGKTNANGVASVNVSLTKKGTYTAVAKFAGDSMYSATSVKFNVKIV